MSNKSYLGLGKVLFNTNICHIDGNDKIPEIALTERLIRKKASGEWPHHALMYFQDKIHEDILISENRDVITPLEQEEFANDHIPFFSFIESKGLEIYSRKYNRKIKFITHHLAHAYAASFMSPYEKAIIFVMDGAGSKNDCFTEYDNWQEHHEEASFFSFNQGKVEPLEKYWQKFRPSKFNSPHFFSEGIGSLYEKSAEFIFNSKRAAGKVMGLSPYGKSTPFKECYSFLEDLNWSLQFNGDDKKSWEESKNIQYYQDLAASVQNYFEENIFRRLNFIKEKYPEYENLIICGGNALNCITNMKIIEKGIYSNIYVPPFPGDESIGLGCANYQFYNDTKIWNKVPFEKQHGYFGPKSSIPENEEVKSLFKDFKITYFENIEEKTAHLLNNNNVIAWFQGRSESGPRALGNRSILASPKFPNLKKYLNDKIKFRESFRPYGSSILHEYVNEYFDVPDNFDNPYMSFTCKVNSNYKNLLKEVTHINGTSRMQTVRPGQNFKYYNLIKEFGKLSNIYCVLNTSLNIMGEPIIETIEDAKKFFEEVPVDALIINNFLIEK